MKTYTKIITAALSFVLFVVFSTSSLHAQQRGGGRRGSQQRGGGPGTQGGPSKMMLPPEFDNRPFDITLQQLPPQYLGCDAELAYTRIKNGQESSKRGEIAAISKYQESTDQGPRLPSPPTLDLESTYAFRVYPEWFYDAHDQVLRVYCPLTAVLQNGKEDQSRKGLRVKYVPRVDNREVVTNAYGKKVEFEELKFREYLIAFANFKEFPAETVVLPSATEAAGKVKKGPDSVGADENTRRETITGNINVAPAEAQQLQERVAVIAVCKLVDPYATSDTVEQKPTPEKPRDYLAQYYYLDVRLLELWFYDFDTGKVLMKMKAQQTSRLP
ncbi:MAG TPA: hypothetical protein VKF36_22240 [Syntrophorhabdales bacterium]|nr:hypothetical protein [Syntrophorhabdales bacterium]